MCLQYIYGIIFPEGDYTGYSNLSIWDLRLCRPGPNQLHWRFDRIVTPQGASKLRVNLVGLRRDSLEVTRQNDDTVFYYSLVTFYCHHFFPFLHSYHFKLRATLPCRTACLNQMPPRPFLLSKAPTAASASRTQWPFFSFRHPFLPSSHTISLSLHRN